MSPNHVVLIAVGVIVAFDALLIFVILPRWIAGMWAPFAEKFPPVDPSPDAVRRSFQSFSVGMINLGYSVHVAADETYLHMYPALFARLFRITPISIPWNEMRPARFRRVQVGMQTIWMPRWCRQLAAQERASV